MCMYRQKPLENSNRWIEENRWSKGKIERGKWMLFYKKSELYQMWNIIRDLYVNGKLGGVDSIKVTTDCDKKKNTGVIIIYCNNSYQKKTIIDIGKKIIKLLGYYSKPKLFYKLDYNENKPETRTNLYEISTREHIIDVQIEY